MKIVLRPHGSPKGFSGKDLWRIGFIDTRPSSRVAEPSLASSIRWAWRFQPRQSHHDQVTVSGEYSSGRRQLPSG